MIRTEESQTVISSKFIDEPDPSLKTERDLMELSRLRAQLEMVGIKLECYSRQIDLRHVQQFSTQPDQPTTAVIKAMRTLCLLLKSLT